MIKSKKNFIKTINFLRNLPDCWDGCGAERINLDTLSFIEKIHWDIDKLMSINPCHNGSIDILLKYKVSEVLINIYMDSFSFFGETMDGQKPEIKGEMSISLLPEFINIISKWMEDILFFVTNDEFSKRIDEDEIKFIKIQTLEKDEEYFPDCWRVYLAKEGYVSNKIFKIGDFIPDWATHCVLVYYGE